MLAKLFGSADKLKLIRLFLLNPEKIFTVKKISERSKITPASLRTQLNLLAGIGFIRKKKVSKQEKTPASKKVEGWCLDGFFPLTKSLRELVLTTALFSRQEFLKKLSKIGQVKLIILAGIFIQQENSRVDIMIVGDKIRKNILERVLKEIEAEVGKELSYAVFATDDFVYRLDICDKFIRDVLDYPHQKILNKLGI